MILENPALAQTGAGDSLLMGNYFAPYGAMAMGGDGEQEHSVHSGEGDTDHGEDVAGGDEYHVRQGLLRNFHKQSSAVNLTRLGNAPAEVRRLTEEVRQLRDENRLLEVALEESKSCQKAAERTADEARDVARRAADTIARLKALLDVAGLKDPGAGAVEVEADGLRTSEQEIELLRAELAEVKESLAKARADKKEAEAVAAKHQGAAVAGGKQQGIPRTHSMPPPSAAAAAAAAAAAFHMPYAMGMLPMFGMSPLNPYGGMHSGTTASPGGGGTHQRFMGGAWTGTGTSMQKVASMPAIAMHHGMMSPPADRETVNLKRKAELAIPEGTEEGAVSGESPQKRKAVEGTGGVREGAHVPPHGDDVAPMTALNMNGYILEPLREVKMEEKKDGANPNPGGGEEGGADVDVDEAPACAAGAGEPGGKSPPVATTAPPVAV